MKVLQLLIILFVILSTTNAEAKFSNRFKKGFYFEKYDRSKTEKVLLELHPIGSNVNDLVKTLRKAGMKIEMNSEREKEDIEKGYFVVYGSYTYSRIPLFIGYYAQILIRYNDKNIIKKLRLVIQKG